MLEIAFVLEHGREVVEAGSGKRVLRAEHLLVNCQRACEERPGPGEIALRLQQAREVVKASRRIEVLRPERRFLDRKRPLAEGFGARQIARVPEEECEIVEDGCRQGMIRAQCLARRQRPLVKRLRVGEIVLVLETRPARLSTTVAVDGCSGPSAVSRIASARS